MAKKKHADTIESMELCEGVYLQEEFFEKRKPGAYSVVEGLHCLSSFDGKYRFLSDGI